VNRLTLGGLACGLALLMATACSSTVGKLSANGPFGNSGTNSGTICAWTTPGGVVYDGFEEFYDTAGSATVGRVVLVKPRHLRLVAAWVAEANGAVAGVGKGYPSPSRAWQRIPDAVVRHTRGQEVISLVIVVKPTAKLGTTTAINLYYNVDGTRYLRHFTDGLKIQVGHICH
jgi:hypothetical protein